MVYIAFKLSGHKFVNVNTKVFTALLQHKACIASWSFVAAEGLFQDGTTIGCFHNQINKIYFLSLIHYSATDVFNFIIPNTTLIQVSLLLKICSLCICNGDFHLNTGFDADGGDLLNNFGWTVQVNQALVDPHLEAIPGFGSFTARSLSGCNAQSLQAAK